MSVLIKGMDMPCMCCLCPCHDWDMETNRYYCQALKDEPRIIDENTRRDDCPLAEIPTPHGRLIDSDKLAKVIEDAMNRKDNPLGYDAVEILGEIYVAKTIIEAEE